MLSGNYTRAIRLFETLEARYPYGRHAQQALLESAYANYRAGETAIAVAAADRFIRTYPQHPSVDYAYYIKGLVHFREDQGLLGYLYETDLSERDPKAMKESFIAFKELAQKFPESRYAEDAQVADALPVERARHVRGARRALLLQSRRVRRGSEPRAGLAARRIRPFPRTRMRSTCWSRSYEKLGLPQLADDSRRILEKTYPQSKYLAAAPAKPWWRFW